MTRRAWCLPAKTFVVAAAIGAMFLNSTNSMLTRPLLMQEALAAVVPCDPNATFPKPRPPSPLIDQTDAADKAPAVITAEQLVYDLCYAAMRVAALSTPSPSAADQQVEDMMRTIAIEGHLYAVCPHQKPVAERVAYAEADYLEHHEYGCGPYRANRATAAPSRAMTASSPVNCPSSRPLFDDYASVASRSAQTKEVPTIPSWLIHSSHPPAILAQASFDLCHAALVVRRMPAADVERYLFRLMMEVHLAQVCSTRRSVPLPSDVEPSYTVTREYGCWTPHAPSNDTR